jgi:plasmid stability protein
MAALTIRNVPDEVRDKLRARAEKNGRSMEAEVRAILEAAARAEQAKTSVAAVQEWIDRIYGDKKPRNVVEDLIAERRREAQREEEEYRRK